MDTATDALTADELQRRVERRRDDVGRDLEVIGDRVSPGRIVERSSGRARRRMGRVRDTVMGSGGDARSRLGEAEQHVEERVEGNPLGAGVVAFGIGFLLGSVLPGSRQEERLVGQVEPVLTEVASTAADEARHAAEELAPTAKEEAAALRDEAADAARTVKDRAGSGSGTT